VPECVPGKAGAETLPVADLSAARACLREILQAALSRGAEQIPLSNVKRLFRSQYQLDLSETALGHTRLLDLLQDDRFADICTVQLQDRGYTVFPTFAAARASANKDGSRAPPEGDGGRPLRVSQGCQPVDAGFPAPQPVAEATIESCGLPSEPPDMALPWKVVSPSTFGDGVRTLQRSFIDVASASPTSPGSAPISVSSPRGIALGTAEDIEDGFQHDDYWSNASDLGDDEDNQIAIPGREARKFCEDQPLSIEEPQSIPGTPMRSSPACPVVTPSPVPQYIGAGHARALSIMRLWSPSRCGNLTRHAQLAEHPSMQSGLEAKRINDQREQRTQRFCADEPLALDEVGSPAFEPSWMSPPAVPVWTPSPQYHCRVHPGFAVAQQPRCVAGGPSTGVAGGPQVVRIAELV